MYIPSGFRGSEDLAWRLMREHPFGMVVTVADGEPFISHVPFELDAAGRLVQWHLARQNPQCDHLCAGTRVTLVFRGPHAYISPRWYDQPAVPTWNYLAVHVSGAAEPMTAAGTASLVAAMSRRHEGEGGLGDFENSSKYSGLLSAIAGFRLRAQDLQSKFKLSQNRSPEDQRAVAQQLLSSSRPADRELGRIMQELLDQT